MLPSQFKKDGFLAGARQGCGIGPYPKEKSWSTCPCGCARAVYIAAAQFYKLQELWPRQTWRVAGNTEPAGDGRMKQNQSMYSK